MRICLALLATIGVTLVGSTAEAGDPHVFSITPAVIGEPEAIVEVDDAFAAQAIFDTVDVAQGWSFGICHDSAIANLDSAVEGATTLTVNQGGPADFSQITIDDAGGGVTMGVVISFLGLDTLPAGGPYEILDLGYTAVADGTTDLCYCNTLGDPPVATVIVVGGASIAPDTVCATVTVSPPPPIFIDLTCIGDVADVSLDWVTQGTPPFDYFTVHKNGELIEFIDNPAGDTSFSLFDDVDIVPGETYTYSVIGVFFPDPMGPATIVEVLCTVTIVSLEVDEVIGSSGFFYGGDTVELVGLGFLNGTVTVDFGANPGVDLVVIDDNNLTVVSPPGDALGSVDLIITNDVGQVIITDGFLYGFVRGDFDCNSTVDIGDAQGLLLYLFSGGPPPCCFDGSDANDDGLLDAADPISVLFHLFDGGPALPEPFPDVLGETLDPADVGLDPTDDALICF